MRILYINDELTSPDGSSYHAMGILQNLKHILGKENVRCYPNPTDTFKVHANRDSHRERNKNLLQLIRVIRKPLLSFVKSFRICRELQKNDWTPTHVLGRTVMFDITALLVARRLQAKLIWEANTPMYYEHCILNHLPFQKLVEYWEKKTLQHSDCIYVVSNKCRDMLCEHYSLSPEKFLVIPNGYDRALYPSSSSEYGSIRHEIRRKEGLSDKFLVTFIGSMKPWHGIEQLCQTAELLQHHSKIHFIVAGNGNDQTHIEKYCSTHNNMTYKGKLSLEEMAKYLIASDLGIMPHEKIQPFYGSPLKMFDMIGAGLPFIGTSQGQVAEVCSQFLTSDFLIEDNTPSTISQRITDIVENQALYAQMRASVENSCTEMTWMKRTETLIDGIKKKLQ